MKTTKLKTSVNSKYIFKQKKLSYHTKCILSKIVTDFIQYKDPLDFLYLEENIFGIWPQNIVINALNELAENDIMFIDSCDCESCSQDECEEEQLLFNPEFLEKACPYINACPCCNPNPTNFNVIYN